jgi:hypothetical protein
MEQRKSVSLTDGLVSTVLMYGGIRTARNIFGDEHPYIQNRAARTITKAVRNMSGLVKTMKSVNKRDRRAGRWMARMYFCLYPQPFVRRWHRQTTIDWKHDILARYLRPDDFERDFTRLELFRLQQRMSPIEISVIGW